MTKQSTISRIAKFAFAATAVVVTVGSAVEADAQTSRDPFAKPAYARPRPTPPAGGRTRVGPDGRPMPNNTVYTVPPIEQRIEFYKRMRESAAVSGNPIPKVTTVLTLDEMAVTGIFRTPRGYAAMVEATPIKMSYTIYPGEKFFDGQLVAVEENQLVFRKVTKTGPDKFVSTVENKPLRKYTLEQELQGTAPTQTASEQSSPASSPAASQQPAITKTSAPLNIVSPLDEMNNGRGQKESDKNKPAKRPSKIARAS